MVEQKAALGWRSQAPGIVLAAIAVGVVVRVILVALPPLFLTDVGYYNAQAVGYLLRGVDPYGAAYSVPAPLATPGAGNVFAYLPGVFAFLVPGGFGSGARAGLVACDLVVAASLFLYRPRTGGILASLFLLLPPIVLFSTAFLNDSLAAIAFLSVAALLESRGRGTLAAALVGLALASSQEAWFAYPIYAAYCLRGRRFRDPLVALAVAAAVVAPFAAWNPTAFVSNTVLFQFQRAATPLVSQGPFGLNLNPSLGALLLAAGVGASLAAKGALAAAILGLVAWRSKASASYLFWGSAVAVGVSLFVLAGDFFWSYLEMPFVLLLFWAGPRAEELLVSASTLKEPAGTEGTNRS